ncbi:MAG: S8 family serine peptidase [Elusimicrobiota bacterium]|jgi:hypothetical protein
MKRLLSTAVASALLLLSFSPCTPVVAQVVVGASAHSAPVAPVMPVAGLNAGALAGTLNLGASALNGNLAPLLQNGLRALPVVAAKVQAAAPAAAQTAASQGGVATQALQTPDGRPTPFASTMQALGEKTPEFKDMPAGAQKDEAGRDFSARIGEGAPAAVAANDPVAPEVELLVSAADGSGRQLTQDIYPEYLSQTSNLKAVETALQKQLLAFGITRSLLSVHGATALGTVASINTTVLRVPGKDADSLRDALKALGLEVQVGRTFALPKPMEAEPAAKTIGLKEMNAVIGADKLQAELKKVLGEPAAPAPEAGKASFLQRAATWLKSKLLGTAVENPVLPFALLDSWSFVDHPFMKGHYLKSVANDNDGEAHGTHTGGTIIGVDIYNYAGRNYNIFPNGSASEGDILFKLNMAQKDGALATSNSWGDGSGNPAGAIEKLFTKQASEGMHHSISAGNSGSRKNTIGGPAIAYHNVDLVINGKVIGQVKRIKAIAASDSDKKTAYFSSRGKGSPTTARDPQYKDWPQKPDESGVGVNLVAPVPSGATVPELGGPGQSMSGTSMSNPGVFGGFMLLTRGILVLLKDYLPALQGAELTQFAMDLARYSMTQTAEKVAPLDEVGDGFINVWNSFQYAAKLLKDNAPQTPTTFLHGVVRRVLGFAPLGR